MKKYLPLTLAALCVLSTVTSCGDDSQGGNNPNVTGYVTMSYNANGIIGLDIPKPVQVEKGKPIPASQLPVLSGANIISFRGWAATKDGGAVTNNPQRDFAVYADAELEFTEKLSLGGGQFALYRFDIPEGAAFSDYAKLSAEYLVEDDDQIKSKNANMILHGAYNGLMLERVLRNGQAAGILFPFAGGADEASIINNQYDSVTLSDMDFSAGRWKTVEYALSGSRHAAFNAIQYIPKQDAPTRYAYFGLGITAAGSGAYVSYIKNVRLVGNLGSVTVLSSGSGFSVPAFAAQDSQWGLSSRETAAGTADVSSGVTLPYLVESHVLGNGQFALYRFDIPQGSTLGDYSKITADYMIENPVIDGEIFDVLEIRDGRMRLMGAYTGNMLIPVTVSGATAGYRVNMPPASVDDTSILNNLVPSSRMVKEGFVSGKWKEIEYAFTGKRPNYYDASTYFPANATGTVYFGLGVTTLTNQFVYTSHIRNIKMTDNTGSKQLLPSPVDYAQPAFYASAETWNMNSRKEAYLEK